MNEIPVILEAHSGPVYPAGIIIKEGGMQKPAAAALITTIIHTCNYAYGQYDHYKGYCA